MAPEISHHIPYFPPPLDRHAFTPERCLIPTPMDEHPQRPDLEVQFQDPTNDILGSDSEVEEDLIIDEVEEDLRENTIPKPSGSVGKPSSGGYSLADVLRWDTTFYKSVQKFLQRRTGERLDPSKSFKDQDAERIADICQEADQLFPVLKCYIDQWPTKDFLYTAHKRMIVNARNKTSKKYVKQPSNQVPQESASEQPRLLRRGLRVERG